MARRKRKTLGGTRGRRPASHPATERRARTRVRGRSGRTARRPPPHRRYARHHAARRHDHQGHARRGAGLPGAVHHRALRCRPLHAADAIAGRRWRRRSDRRADRRPPACRAALDALGGLGSPAGSCVWHVLGLQRSIREWAMRQGWGGRPVRVEQAQGILIAALGVLAGMVWVRTKMIPSSATVLRSYRGARGWVHYL